MKRAFLTLSIWSLILAFIVITSCNSKTQNFVTTSTDTTKSLTAILVDNSKLPIADRIALYYKYKAENPKTNNLEGEMNLYGYSLLWEDKLDDATEIFKLLVAEYPNSSNTYDSLAEALLKAGDKNEALDNYEKSLALDADNFNAEDQIELIKNPDKKPLNPKDKFQKKYSVQEYKDDLDQLGETLLRVHPNALKFITKEKFAQLIQLKKSLIQESTTYAEFSWHCSEIVANINCSHTGTGGFYRENRMLPIDFRFPLQTRLVDNRLYVIDPLNNNDLVSIKDEILSINGVSIKNLIQDIYDHIPSQGYIKTSKRYEFNTWSTVMISFILNFPQKYRIEIEGKEDPIILKKTQYHNDPKMDESMVYCGDNLCLEYIDKGKKIAQMTISSFNYYEQNNLAVFQRFIDESMGDLIENKTEQLIIDLRNNGGGSPESSIHLLKYLIHEPFIYYSKVEFDGKTEKIEGEKEQVPFEIGYTGELYFIIDGKGNSTTGHFMAIAKDRKLGVIVGEELGSNHFCSAGQKPCRLSNTKMNYFVANNTHISNVSSHNDKVGVLPDHFVNQSIDDYIDAKDAVMRYTLDLIGKKMDWESASSYHSSYFLEASSKWRKELFRIPLNFAPDISLRGIEDARFPVGWEVKDSSTFWSYVFAWNVDHPQALTTDELSKNIELYFDGLMNIEKRIKEEGVSKTKAVFNEINSSQGTITYTGKIKTYDAFFEKKPIVFNVKAEQYYCTEIGRSMILFRFTPKSLDSSVWEKLNEVVLPEGICEN